MIVGGKSQAYNDCPSHTLGTPGVRDFLCTVFGVSGSSVVVLRASPLVFLVLGGFARRSICPLAVRPD